MAIRLKTTWHQSKRVRKGKANKTTAKTMSDRASVVGFNVWKVAQQAVRNMMEEEEFRFADDKQTMGTMLELIAFLLQVIDRMVYEQISDEDRAELINSTAKHLAETVANNQTDLFGPGDYIQGFVSILNDRAMEYAKCAYDNAGPGHNFKRVVASHIADILERPDNKWVLEWVMDVEAPKAVDAVKKLVASSLGLKPN